MKEKLKLVIEWICRNPKKSACVAIGVAVALGLLAFTGCSSLGSAGEVQFVW